MMKKKVKEVNKEPMVDGWGLIVAIIGFALVFLGDTQVSRNAGVFILVIGIVRILYILIKYGR
jgi:hypothetical protein|tara:strand:+ start:48 stop:236 length:189 start_codon:yes stop_codon:yes gene_type:complete